MTPAAWLLWKPSPAFAYTSVCFQGPATTDPRGRPPRPGIGGAVTRHAHAEDVDVMARLARTLSLQNQTAKASEWYRKAIALAPSNESLRESLIEQLVREDKISDAIVQYEELSKFDSGNQDHLEDWGQLIISQKDLPQEERQKKAAAVWNRMLVNRADDSVTLARLAGLFRRADVRERAIELYRQAIDKSPNEPQYREYVGEFLPQEYWSSSYYEGDFANDKAWSQAPGGNPFGGAFKSEGQHVRLIRAF